MAISDINSIKKIEDITKERSGNIVNIIKGSIISIILSLIFLSIYAMLLAFTNISENTMVPVVLVITGVSILIGSSISAINIKKQGLINGALIGLIYMLFIYILSSIIFAGFTLNLNSIIMIIVGIVTGMVGGIIGVNIK